MHTSANFFDMHFCTALQEGIIAIKMLNHENKLAEHFIHDKEMNPRSFQDSSLLPSIF